MPPRANLLRRWKLSGPLPRGVGVRYRDQARLSQWSQIRIAAGQFLETAVEGDGLCDEPDRTIEVTSLTMIAAKVEGDGRLFRMERLCLVQDALGSLQ